MVSAVNEVRAIRIRNAGRLMENGGRLNKTDGVALPAVIVRDGNGVTGSGCHIPSAREFVGGGALLKRKDDIFLSFNIDVINDGDREIDAACVRGKVQDARIGIISRSRDSVVKTACTILTAFISHDEHTRSRPERLGHLNGHGGSVGDVGLIEAVIRRRGEANRANLFDIIVRDDKFDAAPYRINLPSRRREARARCHGDGDPLHASGGRNVVVGGNERIKRGSAAHEQRADGDGVFHSREVDGGNITAGSEVDDDVIGPARL